MSIGTTKIILNPEFDPNTYNTWVYRDLQLLAMNLGVKASGKKVCIVRRLKQWHRKQFKEGETLLDSLVLSADKEMNMQPSLLSPLKSKPRRKQDGTPISIKKSRTANKKNKKNKKKKRLSFSVFNGMNIIPARNREEDLPSPPWSIRQLQRSGAIEDYYNGVDDPEEIELMNEENNQERYNDEYYQERYNDEDYDEQESEKEQQWVKLPNGKWGLKNEQEEGRQEDEYREEEKSRQGNEYSEVEEEDRQEMEEAEEVAADVEEEEEEEEEVQEVQRNLNEELLDSVVYDHLMEKINAQTLDDNCVSSATESTKMTGVEKNVLKEKANNTIKNQNILKNNPFEYYSNGISVPVTLPKLKAKLKDAHPKLKDVHEQLAQDLARLMTDMDEMAEKENWKKPATQIADTRHDIKLLNSPIKITSELQQRHVLQERSCNELSDYCNSEDDLEYSQV